MERQSKKVSKEPIGNKYYVTKRSPTGLGLFATEDLPKGVTVIEYFGENLNNKQVQERGGRYLFEINSRVTIDGSGRDNIARYVNHACRPNCEAEIRKGRVYYMTKKKVTKGEELTVDYGKEYKNMYCTPCLCQTCMAKRSIKVE